MSGTTFSLANSGVTAGSYGPTANISGTNGTTINIPQITVDAKGRVTSVTNRVLTNRDTDTTYLAMTGATTSAAGSSGLVPAPSSGSANRYLRSDGTWAVPPDTITTYSAATTSSSGLMTAAMVSKLNSIESNANDYSLPAATTSVMGGVKVGSNLTVSSGTISLTKANVVDALGYTPPTTNITYSVFEGATSSAAGGSGLVPAPEAGMQTSFLRGDGTWQTPTNTIYKAGIGLSLSGTTFNHANYGTSKTIGPSANTSLAFGGIFTVPQVTINAQGHVTGMNSRTITIPQPKLTTSVTNGAVQFRNIVVVAKGTDPNSVICPVGTIICVKE